MTKINRKNSMTEADQHALKQMIKNIEQRFNIEVLTMQVQRSTPIGHVKWIVFLFLTCVALSSNFLFSFEDLWLSPKIEFLMILLELIVAAILTIYLSRFQVLQRFLTSDQDEIRMVKMRSENEFFSNNFHQTKSRNAILFFISEMEHRVHIVADDKLTHILTDHEKDHLLQTMITHLRSGKYFDSYSAALKELSLALESHAVTHPELFRKATEGEINTANELSNEHLTKS